VKYFGKKSLSSFLSGFFHVCWYATLICAVFAGIIGLYLLFAPIDDPIILKIAEYTEWNLQDKDWICMKNLPVAVRMLFIPYFIAIIVLALKMIKQSQALFINFKNEIVLNKSNVNIISKISKLNIGFSILTFNFSSLMVSVLLFMLCEIFKKGALLQEEHDLTV
jgi:hypothetical protein